jgi:hypothetical protein
MRSMSLSRDARLDKLIELPLRAGQEARLRRWVVNFDNAMLEPA